MSFEIEKILGGAYSAIHKKKVLVLGSAPDLKLPDQYSSEWSLICVNASGKAALRYGLKNPDLTVFASSALLKNTPEFREVRSNILGLRCDVVLVRFLGGGSLKRVWRTLRGKGILRNQGYEFGELHGLSPQAWKRMVEGVMGQENYSLAKNISTGVFCIILSIYAGAESVAVCGINPNSIGHSYSKTDFKREHVNSDARVLKFLKEQHKVMVF